MKLIFCLLMVMISTSCTLVASKQKVVNTGVASVLNGYDKPDSVKYTCDSCDKYIASSDIMNKIIERATLEAKESLNNPLSFKPRSMKITVSRMDSLYYYETNKHVDSCLLIQVDYKCIGKNAYGTENEVSTESILFLVGDSLQNDFISTIRKKPLSVYDGVVNRNLTIYDSDGDGSFTIQPAVKQKSLILISTNSCIDKGARLEITFVDGSSIDLNNWKDFNCKGTAYFDLPPDKLEQLRSKKVDYISFSGDKHQFGSVPRNESDYFMQFVNLLSK